MQRQAYFEQFEFQAETRPDATAVETEGSRIDYADLNRRANRIAHALIAQRTAPIVGLFLDPGIDYCAALLGVGKAGGAFLPLPTDLPRQRLDGYLAKADCRLIVTDAAHRAALDEALAEVDHGARIVSSTPEAPDHNPGLAVGPGDPCYVMFTSGSTGTPKAILGQQRGLSHFLRWETGEFALGSDTRCAWLAPIGFDVSLRDMLIPLTAGGTLCVPDPDTRVLPHRLADWIADRRLTLVHCVPTLLRLLTRELGQRSQSSPLPALRHLLVAGEPLLAADVAAWRAAAGDGAELVNLYGPTETTLAKAFHRVGVLPDDPHQVLPIGAPLPNTALLVLSNGRLCRAEEIGEIHIRTPYRSLGYLNDPELTAAAFVPNPLTPDKPELIYRSGDLGRYLPDGSLECLGRLDGQVKINGIRIELAEVETALRALPAIAQAVAAVHQGPDGSRVLVAYYVRSDGTQAPLPVEDLLADLGEILPAALLPRLFVALQALPTTITGKVNRKALPPPEELFYQQHEYQAPETETEQRLATIWRGQFGLARIGVTTSFQAFGGDSLRAIRVVLEIYQQMGVDIGLRDFFADSSIRALAALIDRGNTGRAVSIPRIPDAPGYPLSPAQERLWRLHRMGIAATAYNLFEAYELTGPLDAPALERSLAAIVRRHESLRTVFREIDGVPQQVVLADLEWGLEVRDLRPHNDPEAEARRLAEANPAHEFDLERGPLMRAVLLRLPDRPDGSGRHLFLFNIHHIVSDVWSLGVLVRELAAAYAAMSAGRAPGLPPLTLQQRDILAWQQTRLEDQAAAGQRRYWTERLGGDLPLLDLPADRPRPPVQTFNGDTRRFRFDPELCQRLDALAESRGTTRFAILSALTQALLYRYTGQRDLIIGTPVAGRDHPDLEPQIGCYINTLALRNRIDPAAPFVQLLTQTGHTVQEALANQSYPFDALLGELNLRRDMSRSPVFDVMLVVQTFGAIDLELEGVGVAIYGRENAWNFSRYDLVFHVQEHTAEWLLDLNFNTDLFDPQRIERMGRHLLQLARAAARSPETRVERLDLVPAEERALIEGFNRGPAMDLPPQASIGGLFAATAARFPDRPALLAEDAGLSYRELDRASDRLAAALNAEPGVGPGARVAVIARRSLASVNALLGILKAGAVYVPIDPDYPALRIGQMLAQAECALVLMEDAADSGCLPANAPPGCRIQDLIDRDPVAAAAPEVAGDDLAYVIFTSGSTGRPKAVMVPHRGFVNMALGQIRDFGLGPQDRVLQFASPSFDASLANLFQALFAGAAVVLPAPGSIEAVPRFLQELRRTRTTCLTLPPSYLRTLQRAPLADLRVLIAAGEDAPVADLAHYAGSLHAFNAYGPTEASVCASLYRVRSADADRPRLPIGRPLPNTRLYLLDQNLQTVPLGIPGEIFLGGPGVARGFQGDPALTGERFVTHPQTGERLYRSGDVGCWLADGEVDFLGRRDGQVKVAGHRIETLEVEQALRGLEGIGDAHVMPVQRRDGSLALAAYYCPEARVEPWPSLAEFFVYDHVAYSSMAGDEARNRRYREAFARHLSGKTVVDIGTGPFAILARLALEAGASKVYAIDLLEDTARQARETVARLGLQDHIQVIRGNALDLELPEKVDYCISEIVGAIGGSEGSARIINSARRFLKDPSHMLPQRSLTRIAAVSVPEEDLTSGFSEIAAHYVERIFKQVGRPFDLRLCLKNLPREALVSDAGVFEDLDYTRDTPLEASHDVELSVTRACSVTGLLVWLQLHVDAEHRVDILESPESWLPVYLPVFPDGVAVAEGDLIRFRVTRTLCGNGLNPDFGLSGQVLRADGGQLPFQHASLHFAAGFRASPFYQRLFPEDGVPRHAGPTPVSLRRRLSHRLPGYSLPAYLIPIEHLPLNLSGKVDRSALPPPITPAGDGRRSADTPLEEHILAVWREVLELDELGPDDDFFSLGGDSIRAIQIVSRLLRDDLRVETRDIFQNPTPAQLAGVVRPLQHEIPQGPVSGEGELTPIQRWFFETVTAQPQHFNQAVLLHSHQGIDPAATRTALAALWRHHDALRTRFEANGELPHPVYGAADAGGPGLSVIELPEDEAGALEAAAQALHSGFVLARGPLFCALLARGRERDRLLLVAHHLVTDAVSWRILLEDFETAYQLALAGAAVELPPKTLAYRDHARALAALAGQIDWAPRLAYWDRIETPAPLWSGRDPDQRPCSGQMEQVTAALAEEHTAALLGSANQAYQTRPEDLLLTALGLALQRNLGRRHTLVTLETHGRESPVDDGSSNPAADVERSVGWFTNFYPFRLEIPAHGDTGALIRSVKQDLAQVPDRGRSYGLMTRHPAGPGREALSGQVGFNYLGNMGSGGSGGRFQVDWNAPGPALGAQTPRPHDLDLLGMVVDGRLELCLDYDRTALSRGGARDLLQDCIDALVELLAHCGSPDAVESAPSDFSYQGLSADQLDDLLMG